MSKVSATVRKRGVGPDKAETSKIREDDSSIIPIDRARALRSGKLLGDLEHLVAFQLRIAQAASFQAFAQLTGHRRLRPGYYAILSVIHANPGINQTDLSRVVGRDKTTLTPTLKDMKRAQLIEHQPHPSDRRARMLTLTERGEETLAELTECGHQHDRRLDAILGQHDREEALRILKKLIAGLERSDI